MSTDFKSADQKLKEIVSKSKDVDPDLRFMALNDLNRLLIEHSLIINKVNSYSSKIVKILLEALNDTNSDVQNQSLKCFQPLVSSLDDEEVLEVLIELNKIQITSNSITTSIHTMAASEILKNINLKHASTGEKIIVQLLPSLIGSNGQVVPSLDAIETLSDLIVNLGAAIPELQVQIIYKSLVKTIFNGQNILSKKSISSLGSLIGFLSPPEVQQLLILIDQSHSSSYESINLALLTYITLAKTNVSLLSPYTEDLLNFSFKNLYQNSQDLDDDQVKIDDVRYDALQLINSLLPQGELVESHIDEFLQIIQRFLEYDPYNNEDEDLGDDNEDELSDTGYSDDEDYDDFQEESDDNTWKLRKQSSEITSTLIKVFPRTLLKIYSTGIFETILKTISDSSEIVSFEKIRTMTDIISATIKQHGKRSSRKRRGSDVDMTDAEDSLTYLKKYRNSIVVKFTKELDSFKSSDISKYNTFLNFFQTFNKLDEDLKKLLSSIREHNFGLSLDLLKFYSSVLNNNDLEYFGSELSFIIETINKGLTSKNHISILNSIATSVDLLDLTYIEVLPDSILDIANDAKNDSELRNTAVQSLGDLKTLPAPKLSQVFDLFINTLKYEPIITTTIISISSLVEKFNDDINPSQINEIVKSYKNLINNINYSSYAIESLTVISRYFQLDSSIAEPLISLFNSNKHQSSILRVLAHLDKDRSVLQKMFLKASTIDEIDEEALIDVSRKIGADLIPTLEQNASNPRNIKILASIVVNENLRDYISIREKELLLGENKSFNIKLLGYIGETFKLSITIDQFIKYFDDDEVKIYAAEALGRLTSKNSQHFIPIFLEKVKADENRYLLLILIKQILKINNGVTFEVYNEVWDTIISVLASQPEINEDLSKIAAQNIGLILVNNNDINYFYNKAIDLLRDDSKPIVYTLISALKFIIAYDNIISIELVDSTLLEVFGKITNEDLRIKQISIITLVTALNNNFNLLIPYLPEVLPYVYGELAPRKQYEEVLQIGPFKHKVDKALEVRKIAFEILYKLSLNHSVLKDVDFNEILSAVINNGIVLDIIQISSLIIMNLLEFDDVLLSTEDKEVLSAGIDKLLSAIKKREEKQKDSKEEQESKAILINLRNTIFQV